MDLDRKGSCGCDDVGGSRMRGMTMEYRRRDRDMWLPVACERCPSMEYPINT